MNAQEPHKRLSLWEVFKLSQC